MVILNNMEDTEKQVTQPSGAFTYYVLGAVVIALIAGGVYFLRPKATSPTSPQPVNEVVEVVPTPTPGPITGLACEQQYYNPVVGFKKYYLGVGGVDLMTTKKVDCNLTVSVAGKVVATASAESGLTAVTERSGGTFRCDSKGLELEANVPTVVDVILTNDKKETATCTQTFVLPPQ